MTEDDELFADMPRAYIRGLEKGKGYVKENYLRERREWIKLRQTIAYYESEGKKKHKKRLAELYREEKQLAKALADMPPDPILPPPAPLIKVRGVVKNYHQRCLTHYFDTKAYPQTWEYFSRQDENMASAAMVLASMGSAATAQAWWRAMKTGFQLRRGTLLEKSTVGSFRGGWERPIVGKVRKWN